MTADLAATFHRISALTDEAARQRFGELMWYAVNNIALPEEELGEAQLLADRLGVRLEWRYYDLVKQQWREGRA